MKQHNNDLIDFRICLYNQRKYSRQHVWKSRKICRAIQWNIGILFFLNIGILLITKLNYKINEQKCKAAIFISKSMLDSYYKKSKNIGVQICLK